MRIPPLHKKTHCKIVCYNVIRTELQARGGGVDGRVRAVSVQAAAALPAHRHGRYLTPEEVAREAAM